MVINRLQLLVLVLCGCLWTSFQLFPKHPEKTLLINLINNLRKEGYLCGKQSFSSAPPLQRHPLLDQAAETHLKSILKTNRLTHIGADGVSMAKRLSEVGYTWEIVAENIAQGQNSESKVLEYWKTKGGSCKNLLHPKFKHIGIAYHEGYWVVYLASPL